MTEMITIAIGQLLRGRVESIHEKLSPAFLEVEEEELRFETPVLVTGEASVVDDTLIVQFQATVDAKMPCSICNQWCSQTIKVDGYYTLALVEIKGDKWDMTPLLRQEILLEVPAFAECQGNCPHHDDIKKYLRKSDETSLATPFESLNLEE